MLTQNNAAIHLITRRTLLQWSAQGVLDAPSMALLNRCLQKTLPRSASGWVYLLADALGANLADALDAGCLAELFCATVDLIDDVEDGDARAYLSDVPESVHVNTSVQLLALTAAKAGDIEARSAPAGSGVVQSVFALLSAMITGQRMDLVRNDWSPEVYVHMTELMGGRQIEAYLRMAACAARVDVAPMIPVANPLGLLYQIANDVRSREPRFYELPRQEMRLLHTLAKEELLAAVQSIPEQSRVVLGRIATYASSTTIDE